MDRPDKIFAVVPAAGRGVRFGAPLAKQYCKINQQTILEHTLNRLLSFQVFEKIIVCLAADDEVWPSLALASHRAIIAVEGGASRAQSVLNGLTALNSFSSSEAWVMVHDAARPCITVGEVQNLITQVLPDSIGGLLALPVVETVKQSPEEQNKVEATLDRSRLWLAQTPQMFRLGLLHSSIQQALQSGHSISDEASAVELFGHQPILVPGLSSNIKITKADDLQLATHLLSSQDS